MGLPLSLPLTYTLRDGLWPSLLSVPLQLGIMLSLSVKRPFPSRAGDWKGKMSTQTEGTCTSAARSACPWSRLFDLDVPNGSLAADQSNNGYIVYVMDTCGYGKSSRLTAMEPSQDAFLKEMLTFLL